MEIRQVTDGAEKRRIARRVLETLPDWFSHVPAREEYIAQSVDKLFFCAYDSDSPIGFLYGKETGKDTVELYVMGVLRQFQRQGVGRRLVTEAKRVFREKGYSFLQVKTVRMGKYREYDDTNLFYLSLGFREFEVFPRLWDADNPCQVYIMYL